MALRDDNQKSFGGAEVFAGRQDPSPSPPDVGAYDTLIKDLLVAAEDRAKGLEARGIAVITTSGTLVTLLLAAAGLATRTPSFSIDRWALDLAAAAGICFALAALCALLANLPKKRWMTLPDTVRTELWDRWGDDGDRPLEKVTATRLKLWEAVHDQTQFKAKAVFGAIALEGIAIAFLTGAVGVILL
jgi:hypothetical protein